MDETNENKAPRIESIHIQYMHHVYIWTYSLYTMLPNTGRRKGVEADFYAQMSLNGLQ